MNAANLGKPRVVYMKELPGEPMINMAGVIELARAAGTPQGDLLYREFNKAYSALLGQPLSAGQREWEAFRKAYDKLADAYPDTAPLRDLGRGTPEGSA